MQYNTSHDIGDTVYIIYPDYSLENLKTYKYYQILECIIDGIEIYHSDVVDQKIYYHLHTVDNSYRDVRTLETEIFDSKNDAKQYLLQNKDLLSDEITDYINSL